MLNAAYEVVQTTKRGCSSVVLQKNRGDIDDDRCAAKEAGVGGCLTENEVEGFEVIEPPVVGMLAASYDHKGEQNSKRIV